ncbi:MAG: CPBP family intramembrane metalloprotease [Anaerolineaceae bacterium]|nr:CPBP family intramembrane metalloprotease [Anaerolineaceae bacterium]
MAILFLTLTAVAGVLLRTFNIPLGLDNRFPYQLSSWVQTVGILIVTLSILFTLLLAAKFLDRRQFADFGFHLDKNWWRDFIFGLLLGAGLMGAIFLLEFSAGWVSIERILSSSNSAPFWQGWFQSLFLFICVGIYEESISRGYLLLNLAEGFRFSRISPKWAVRLAWGGSSVVFGLLHAGNPHASVLSTINLIAAGLFLGLGYVLTRELAIPIGLHITWNFFQGNVFGFPVSGTTPAGTLFTIQQHGQDLITGGRFGPEAGLIGIAAMLLGSLLIYGWVKLRNGKAALQEGLAIYHPTSFSQFTNKQIHNTD